MPVFPSQPVLPGTPAFASLNNQRRSTLLKLPAEVRNTIFAYVFQEHCILVRRLAGDKMCFRVQPQGFPSTQYFPLSDLLARAKVCRQIYQETSGLTMRLNSFRLGHIDCIDRFVERLYPWELGAVRSVVIGMPYTRTIRKELLRSGLSRLVNLKHVVVDMKSWPVQRRMSTQNQELFALTLMTCIGEFLDVEFV